MNKIWSEIANDDALHAYLWAFVIDLDFVNFSLLCSLHRTVPHLLLLWFSNFRLSQNNLVAQLVLNCVFNKQNEKAEKKPQY